MTPAEVSKLKSKIDADLLAARPEVGIAFGSDAFLEFAKAGWLVKKPFQMVGFPSVVIDLDTYSNHYAFENINMPIDEAEVGK